MNCAWNWLAPEMMVGELPHEKTDMYSFCSFVWELFNSRDLIICFICLQNTGLNEVYFK